MTLEWTADDEAQLVQMRSEKAPYQQIADVLERTLWQVRRHAVQRGMSRPIRPYSQKRAPVRGTEITEIVREFFGESQAKFYGQARARVHVIPRHVGMLMVLEFTNLSLPQIAQIFKRDHTTIIHARESIRIRMECSATLTEQVQAIRAQITAACRARIETNTERMGAAAWNEFERAESVV